MVRRNTKVKYPRPYIRPYQFRDYLHAVDGVVVYKNRIVVPPALHKEVLAVLNAAHQSVSSMIARAETSVFWPGITVDINNKRNSCNACNRMAPSQPSAPPTPLVSPVYPFQCICADYFHYKGTSCTATCLYASKPPRVHLVSSVHCDATSALF